VVASVCQHCGEDITDLPWFVCDIVSGKVSAWSSETFAVVIPKAGALCRVGH
jgi:hypothetical protein